MQRLINRPSLQLPKSGKLSGNSNNIKSNFYVQDLTTFRKLSNLTNTPFVNMYVSHQAQAFLKPFPETMP